MSNTITIEMFVDKQIEEWGFDYIESLFNDGYTPTFVVENDDGRWMWVKESTTNQVRSRELRNSDVGVTTSCMVGA